MSELTTPSEPVAPAECMRAHDYPAWLVGVALALVAAVVYSAILLPKYYAAARLVDKAQQADAAQQLSQSASLLEEALRRVPDSKKIRVQLAYEDFKLPTEQDHDNAMGALMGVTLDADEWNKLATVMPAEYQNAFHPAEDK